MADYLPKAEQLDTMNQRLAELNEHLQKREDFTAAMAKLDSATKKAESLKDGFSPTATVTQTSTGATVTITDKTGTTTAEIKNGKDGTNGLDALRATKNYAATYTTIGCDASWSTDFFNRMPVVGDIFTNIDASSNTGTWKITSVSGGLAHFTLLSYVSSKGSDANVTKENVVSALGYTPLSSADGSVQNAHLADSAVTTDKLAEAERMTSENIVGALGYEPEKAESPYEFINSVTATEDVAAVDVCKDADGNTFNLKHVYVVITQDGSITSDQYASTYIRCYNSTGGTIAIYIYAAYVFSSTKKYVVMWGHNYGERVEYEYQSYSTENDGSGELISYRKQCKMIPNAKIYSVFIGSGSKIKKGTTVTVYGIRA